MAGLRTGAVALFAEREIFLRSEGRVRFIRIGARTQIIAAALVTTLLVGSAGATAAMLLGKADIAAQQAALARQGAAIAGKARRVNAYGASVDDIAQDLKSRQDFLEELYKSNFGSQPDAQAVVGRPAAGTQDGAKQSDGTSKKISAIGPEARGLLTVEQRQLRFARLLKTAVAHRTQDAEAAIRSFGLNPSQIARRSGARGSAAQGGPFIPWNGDRDALTEEFTQLASAISRLNALENGLVAIPSGKPTATPMLSSSYGYRRDPFNGAAAFHAGLDFPGAYGQPILAAAGGRVSYVGQRQGYGNVVEVDHGNGLMTRYAHLSRFTTRIGQTVARGDQIARMGSTGRSTGTHLHFEVRMNGAPINPRRFLEADRDVLEAQKIAKQRFAEIGNRG
ncbi:M23 family metallopeptidase [Sphingobium aquiterrae]|uniref:M23 family metallopeptidase n=1 Tax=Sphingobium aquiterrae TaxID=2038656 RepID=UPI003018FAE7